jgi:hypothetical protein
MLVISRRDRWFLMTLKAITMLIRLGNAVVVPIVFVVLIASIVSIVFVASIVSVVLIASIVPVVAAVAVVVAVAVMATSFLTKIVVV